MADAIEQRDFFISFNSADLTYAEAIDAALKGAGFTTYFHPIDLAPGGNIPLWMDNALMNSRQMLALCTPDYMAEGAVYSEAERYAQFWRDSRGAKSKLIFVELQRTTFTPLMSLYKRIDATGKNPAQAAAAVILALKKPEEAEQRKIIQSVEPLPKIFNVLYRHNPNFTGRLEAMESLQKSLREGNAAITAVAGMGGVGKTTLAAEYCHRFGGRYGGVWWVRAEQESVMLTDLAALGQRLGLAATGNIETDVRAALENLASRAEPWLTVYDNAPNADAVSKWLPSGAVRCLITSRFAAFDHVARVTKLDQWSDEVTADYLLARSGRNGKEGALHLAHALGGLPLAAEQAAAFLKDRGGIGFDDYARELTRLIKEGKPAGAKGDYPDTVYAAFIKSFETLKGTKDGDTALNLLQLCAFLSPDGVDLALLTIDKNGEILPTDFAGQMADNFRREGALAALASLSLLRRDDGPMGSVLIFHRLLLEVMRDWMSPQTRDSWGGAAVRLVNAAFPFDADTSPSNWPVCVRLMPHVAPLGAYTPHADDVRQELGNIFNQAGTFLYALGESVSAANLAEKALALAQPSIDPRILGVRLNNLALYYADVGRVDEAENLERQALAIEEQLPERNEIIVAIRMSNLAQIYMRRKKFTDAEPLLLRVVEFMKDKYGLKSAEYGHAISDLGALYSLWADEPEQKGRSIQAEAYLTQALAITRATRGERHPHTATHHSNLAVRKSKQNNWNDAAAEAERAVAIMISLDLARHAITQLRMRELISFWQRSSHPDKAARLQSGDVADLLPVIDKVETEHRAWVAEDPKSRSFGPPSPFTQSGLDVKQMSADLAKRGVDLHELMRRTKAGELSQVEFNKIVIDALAAKKA